MEFTIPKELVENYVNTIDALSDNAKAAVARQMAGIEFNDISKDRQRIQNLLKAFLRPYMDVSARTTAEFYNIIREWQLGERLEETVTADEIMRPEATDDAVAAFMQKAVDGNPERVAALVQERIAYEIKRSCEDSLAKMASKDKAKVMFARVPGYSKTYGSDGCMFCKMLAGLGWRYYDKNTAGSHWHAHCTCVAVPGFKSWTSVEGYNPAEIAADWEADMNALAEKNAEKNGTTAAQEYDILLKKLGEASKRAKMRNGRKSWKSYR